MPAYTEGYDAYCTNLNSNPYPRGSDEWHEWDLGWDAAAMDENSEDDWLDDIYWEYEEEQ